MHSPVPLRVTAIAAVALAGLVGGCTQGQLAPLPSPPSASASGSDRGVTTSPPAPSATAPAGPIKPAGPTRPVGTTKPPPIRCKGAVLMEIDTRAPGRSLPSRCITVGGVLRLRAIDISNDAISSSPSDATSCFYAAGTVQCRLVSIGTVQMRITNSVGDRRMTVKVIGVGNPPKPAPECGAVSTETYPIPSDDMEYPATCVTAGSVVRLTGLGPDDLAVRPAALASCGYEAGVHTCRLGKRGTVRLGSDLTSEYRSITVVVH